VTDFRLEPAQASFWVASPHRYRRLYCGYGQVEVSRKMYTRIPPNRCQHFHRPRPNVGGIAWLLSP